MSCRPAAGAAVAVERRAVQVAGLACVARAVVRLLAVAAVAVQAAEAADQSSQMRGQPRGLTAVSASAWAALAVALVCIRRMAAAAGPACAGALICIRMAAAAAETADRSNQPRGLSHELTAMSASAWAAQAATAWSAGHWRLVAVCAVAAVLLAAAAVWATVHWRVRRRVRRRTTPRRRVRRQPNVRCRRQPCVCLRWRRRPG